jgi:hypothetical protein
MPTNDPPDKSTAPAPLPLSLAPGVRSRKRAVVAVGVVVLSTDDAHGPGYLGNWQPVREIPENPKRAGWSWIPARFIDWSSVK